MLEVIGFITISVALTIAFFVIRRFSLMLVANKVFANEKLMLIHLCSYYAFTMVTLVICILIFFVGAVAYSDQTESEKRLTFAVTILRYLQGLFGLPIIFTMVLMFHRHSQPVTKR